MKPESGASHRVILALRRIVRAVEIHSKRLEREFGLTVPQLLILEEIGEKRDVSASRLAEVLSMSQATITTVIDRLESHGFVGRVRSTTDKRVVHVSLTEKAREVLERNPTVLQKHFTEKLDKLQEWEQTLILSSIQRIAAMMSDDGKSTPMGNGL